MIYVDRYFRLTLRQMLVNDPTSPVIKEFIFNEDWKVTFRIRKSASLDYLSFNTAEISVYNMSSTTRAELAASPVYISLVAGCKEFKGQLFTGTLSNMVTTKRGTDLITTLYCASDTVSYSQGISIAPQNISVTDLIAHICNKYGITYRLPFSKSELVQKSYIGTVSKVLAMLCYDFNISMGVDNGVLLFRDKKTTAEQLQLSDAITLTPDSGLLGNPTVTDVGTNVHAFIQPNIRVNDYYRLYAPYAEYDLGNLTLRANTISEGNLSALAFINTNTYNGVYRALSIVHSGDTRGNAWYTDIQGSKL